MHSSSLPYPQRSKTLSAYFSHKTDWIPIPLHVAIHAAMPRDSTFLARTGHSQGVTQVYGRPPEQDIPGAP